MNKNNKSISNSELEIIRVVSSNGEVTSKFIIESLCEVKKWKESTVKTFINRLLEKGFLKKRVDGKRYYYSTDYDVENRCKNKIKDELSRICNTKVGEVIKCILEDIEISKYDIDNIVKILKEKKETAPKNIKCNCIKGQCTCINVECDDCNNKIII